MNDNQKKMNAFYSKNPKLLMEELAFQAAILGLNKGFGQNHISKPGEFILQLPKEARETLLNLKSDHIKNSIRY